MVRPAVPVICMILLFTNISLAKKKVLTCPFGWTLRGQVLCEMPIPAGVSQPFDDYCAALFSTHVTVAGVHLCRRSPLTVLSNQGNGMGHGGLPPI